MTPVLTRHPTVVPEDASLLIVDDDEVLLARLARAMTERGFQVRTANSVADGLKLLADAPPRFAIFDLRIGRDSGLDLVAALHLARADARPIVLTGYGSIATAVSAAKFGATDYLPKPADADEIVDALLAPVGGLANPPDHPMSPHAVRIEHIVAVLETCGQNLSAAARQLNMHRRTLQRIVRKEGLGRS